MRREKIMFKNPQVDALVKKHSLRPDSTNREVRKFILDFNPHLAEHGYPEIRQDLRVFCCDMDYDFFTSGISIFDANFRYILLMNRPFITQERSLSNERLPHKRRDRPRATKQEILKEYVSVILHEMTHQIRDAMSTDYENIPGHDPVWLKVARFLGVEEKYLEQYT